MRKNTVFIYGNDDADRVLGARLPSQPLQHIYEYESYQSGHSAVNVLEGMWEPGSSYSWLDVRQRSRKCSCLRAHLSTKLLLLIAVCYVARTTSQPSLQSPAVQHDKTASSKVEHHHQELAEGEHARQHAVTPMHAHSAHGGGHQQDNTHAAQGLMGAGRHAAHGHNTSALEAAAHDTLSARIMHASSSPAIAANSTSPGTELHSLSTRKLLQATYDYCTTADTPTCPPCELSDPCNTDDNNGRDTRCVL